MDDAVLVGLGERVGDLPGDPDGVRESSARFSRAASASSTYCIAMKPGWSVRGPVHGADVRVIQARGGLRLAQHSRPGLVVEGGECREDLESDFPAQPRVFGEVDLAHSARSERGNDDVTPDDLSGCEHDRPVTRVTAPPHRLSSRRIGTTER